MKLGFITHKQDIRKDFGNIVPIHRYAILNNKKNIDFFQKEGFLKPSNRALQLVEVLQFNDELIKFVNDVKTVSRGLFNIQEYNNETLPKKWETLNPNEVVEELGKTHRAVIARELLKNYDINDEVALQLPTIIHFNCIFLPLLKPEISISKHDKKSICIQIFADITPYHLKEYIDKNQDEFNKEVSTLSRKSFFISNRDLYIYNERDRGKDGKKISFSNITENVGIKFGLGGKKETNTTEATIKTAYRRTKEKINSLFHKKKH